MSFLPYAYLAAYSYAARQKSISADEVSSLQKWSIKQQQKTFAFPYRNILDEEEEAVEVETKDLAQEISSLLSQLEGRLKG